MWITRILATASPKLTMSHNVLTRFEDARP
jgi:hypothetical protein